MTHPTVTLAGTEYSVPPLVPKQLKFIIPAILRSMPKMIDYVKAIEEKKIFETEFPVDAYTDFLTIVWWGALWPNNKEIKHDAIEEMPITFDELSKAIVTIQRQSGFFGKVGDVDNTGEQPLTQTPPNDTSTASTGT